jgi:hypothetical protein
MPPTMCIRSLQACSTPATPDNPLKLEGGGVTDVERLQVMAAFLAENPKLLDQLLKLLK